MNIYRLHFAMTICISNEIQYLCPVATAASCGMTLWNFTANHICPTAYKDILIAMDKVRLWRVDHFQFDIHNLMILLEIADDTNDNTMPGKPY